MMQGYSDVLIGLQYGDEGKARVVDALADHYDVIARFNGGANAGHTVVVGGTTLALKQVPSGIFHPNKILYIGSGCVVNLVKLVTEIQVVRKAGIDLRDRLFISGQASLIQPHHLVLDTAHGKAIGTTRNGIGPCYADRASRMCDERLLNVRLADVLANPEVVLQQIKENCLELPEALRPETGVIDEMILELKEALTSVQPYVTLDPLFLERRVRKGAKVLFEGAQSCMLDVTRGSVPYVTSSNTVAAAAYVGGDLSQRYHRKTIGVAKAFMSRVGHGPFPSELGGEASAHYCAEGDCLAHGKKNEAHYNIEELLQSGDALKVGIALRVLSDEYGTGTGRPRRIGMLDTALLSHSVRMNGVDGIFLTKCDLLEVFERTPNRAIPVVRRYLQKGKEIDYVPMTDNEYEEVEPVISEIPAFSAAFESSPSFSELDTQLASFVRLVEEDAGVPIFGLGLGPERDQMLLDLNWIK